MTHFYRQSNINSTNQFLISSEEESSLVESSTSNHKYLGFNIRLNVGYMLFFLIFVLELLNTNILKDNLFQTFLPKLIDKIVIKSPI